MQGRQAGKLAWIPWNTSTMRQVDSARLAGHQPSESENRSERACEKASWKLWGAPW